MSASGACPSCFQASVPPASFCLCPLTPLSLCPGSLSGQGSRHRSKAAVLRLGKAAQQENLKIRSVPRRPEHFLPCLPSKLSEAEGGGARAFAVSWLQKWTFREAWPGQGSGLRRAEESTATTCPHQPPGGALGSAPPARTRPRGEGGGRRAQCGHSGNLTDL